MLLLASSAVYIIVFAKSRRLWRVSCVVCCKAAVVTGW
jgi:hypothetical protein